MTTTEPEFSLWLLARDDQQQRLRQAVQALADLHQGHRFEPHLTLQGDLPLDLARAAALLQALAAGTPVLHWPVTAVEGTEHYFRRLYLRLDGAAVFPALLQQCQAASGTAEGLSPWPHVSLAYGPPQPQAAVPLAARLVALKAEHVGHPLVFDRIALCRSAKAVPIADWRVLQVLPLQAAVPA